MVTIALSSRRSFVQLVAIGAAGLVLPQAFLHGQAVKKEKPPALQPDLVKEYVVAAHGNFKRTKELLEQEPGLLNGTWDWGGGDFEMGIEGAGHVGSKEVANYLISQGAHMTVFVATMLGRMDIVKPILTTFPDVVHSKGPHGLGFIHHAKQGGEEASGVLEYLQALGAS